MPAGDGGRAMTDSHEEKALLGLCRAPSLMSATPSRVRSAPHARAAYGHVPYKVRRRSMQIYSPPGTARSFARRCACSELAGIRLLIRSRRHSLKYSLTRPTLTHPHRMYPNTRTPVQNISTAPGGYHFLMAAVFAFKSSPTSSSVWSAAAMLALLNASQTAQTCVLRGGCRRTC